MSPDVVIVGSAVADLAFRVASLPHPGSSMVAESRATFPGGKGANQAVAAARFGAGTAFCGAVGDDTFGQILTQSLVSADVDVTGLLIRPDVPTGLASIAVDADGQNQIIVDLGANDTYFKADFYDSLDSGWHPKVVGTVLEIPTETVVGALAWGQEIGATTVLNAAPPRELPAGAFAHVDILVVNEHESAFYTQIDPQTEAQESLAAQALQKLGPQTVILTLGSKGALVRQGDSELRIAAPVVQAVDSVGAGDCFVGVLCACLAAGDDVQDAAQTAVRAASTSVMRPGAQPGMPSRFELI